MNSEKIKAILNKLKRNRVGTLLLFVLILPFALILLFPFAIYVELQSLVKKNKSGSQALMTIDATPDNPVNFAVHDGHWLAVRTNNRSELINILESSGALRNVQLANWETGLGRSEQVIFHKKSKQFEHFVYITPELNGWVLLIGTAFLGPNWTQERNIANNVFSSLSTRFPEVQFFVDETTTGTCGWARAINGQLQRLFVYGEGIVQANFGIQQAEESCCLGALNLSGLDSIAATHLINQYEANGDEEKPWILTNEGIAQLAGYWSLNPHTLEDLFHHYIGVGHIAQIVYDQ